MHIDPGWQLSGELTQSSPTFALCQVAQSQTVASVVATPVNPARKTQLKPALVAAQAALPRGLHASVGGEQKYTPSTKVEPLASVRPVFVQCELTGQSESARQVL
jgi:hypothetical protein